MVKWNKGEDGLAKRWRGVHYIYIYVCVAIGCLYILRMVFLPGVMHCTWNGSDSIAVLGCVTRTLALMSHLGRHSPSINLYIKQVCCSSVMIPKPLPVTIGARVQD